MVISKSRRMQQSINNQRYSRVWNVIVIAFRLPAVEKFHLIHFSWHGRKGVKTLKDIAIFSYC